MAAELVGGAYLATEVIEHGAEAGYAAYIVSRPTLPLKATFERIATAEDDHTRRSLARSHHTLTVVGNKAYIFGGTTSENNLASNDIHAITLQHSSEPEMDYSLIPALPAQDDGQVPTGRSGHAACAFHGSVAVYGGCDDKDKPIDEKSSMWLFNPERKSWEHLLPSTLDLAPGPRQGAKLFAKDKCIVLFGGFDSSSSAASDIWQFDVAARTWYQLPTAPVATSNVAFVNGQIWLISGTDSMSSQLHHLDISLPKNEMSWDSYTFPTNPLAPGPRARQNGALLPITTGYGRNYLVYLLGARADSAAASATSPAEKTQFSDTWTLQLPSSNLDMKPSTSFKEAIKPAKMKDAIRSALGAESGELSWAEAVIQLPSDKGLEEDGKLHPGPRAFFAADVMEDQKSLVFWAGVDARGQVVGDGWVVRLK